MKQPNRSRGFSLILSLTVMAGVVLLVVTLSSFITIESRAAINQQLATRARLNAVVSMRLALAHLQQEAGPDRRSTARADITQPNVSASSLRNPMWTGVWRTDLPDLPPAWIVSGRGDQPAGSQMASLFDPRASRDNPAAKPDYPTNYWAPWQNDYAPPANTLIPLVGLGSAMPTEGGKPSGLVSLPKVSLPDEQSLGSYAYWVGDEGIKARINLTDARSARYGDVDQLKMLRSAITPNYGMLTGLENLTNAAQLTSIDSARHLPMVAGFADGADAGNAKRLFHDVTLTSAGLLADSAHGGLRRDLSLAFELNDRDFAASEFGEGPDLAAATHTGDRYDFVRMPVLNGTGNGRTTEASPIFNRNLESGKNVRGPTWWALRDYHRLYRQLGWTAQGSDPMATSTPSLSARTLWPNVAAAHPNGSPASSGLSNNSLRNRSYGYPDLYDAAEIPGIDPNTVDYQLGGSNRLTTRPLAVSATPYLQRLTLAFSVQKMGWRERKRERRGMSWVWVTYDYIEFRFNLTPIVVIHNPYNVQMAWNPSGKASASASNKSYAAAVSLSNLKNWNVVVKHYTPGASTPSVFARKDLADFLQDQNTAVTADDTVRFYLSDTDAQQRILIEPGEFRIFSCKPEPRTLWTKSVALNNTYDTRGGFQHKWEENWDEVIWNSTEDLSFDNPLSFEIIPPADGGKLSIRHGLACWPGDDLTFNQTTDKILYDSSEVSKIEVSGINRTTHPGAGERLFPDWASVADLYPRPAVNIDGRYPYPTNSSPPNEGDLITVIDITAKPADSQDARFPLVSHSNPFAPAQLASAGGRYGVGEVRTGTAPSYQMTVRPGTIGWENVISNTNQGRTARGGSSSGPSGAERAIMLEVPLVAPTSLAQYAHANFGVRDQQPLLSIGNSFATPFVSASQAIQRNNSASWTEYDQSYLLNAALWDGYFLSGIGPRMRTGGTGAIAPAPVSTVNPAYAPGNGPTTSEPNVSLTVPQLVDEIARGVSPLPNPRLTTLPIPLDGAEKALALQNHRKSAKALLNLGAFNVNSTSVEAWTSFLGSTKGLQMPGVSSQQPGSKENARFPRLLSKLPTVPAKGNALDESNWNGFNNLTDAQIKALAEAIVAENKDRFAIQQRTEYSVNPGTRLFRGLSQAATPYLSLAEFINRFLVPDTSPDSWANRCGAFQAAIFRADHKNAGINDRLFGGVNILGGELALKVTAEALQTPTAGQFDFPENIEVRTKNSGTNRTHVAMGAPGSLLQSDLLQALGPALATRSDTFTIRCYGEANTAAGDTGSAWMEVVVQRLPEFIDTIDPPETANAPIPSLGTSVPANLDASFRPRLDRVNHILGRRFKVISMRWLRFDEI
jgi:hypothetical protein